ncbi:hypothetical protein HNY73_012183 [Argiope bruennichi]|uniref:Uncharacterized protein n=1 Tax=Argiope bruennichi TaxID=94029 RepID=A0A8T0EYK1_ARGBR|nr:hypothetical protein HNY73_012183 [Argiope bruennichi]
MQIESVSDVHKRTGALGRTQSLLKQKEGDGSGGISNPRLHEMVPKTSALDRSATLPQSSDIQPPKNKNKRTGAVAAFIFAKAKEGEGSGGIRTHASEEMVPSTSALEPLGHAYAVSDISLQNKIELKCFLGMIDEFFWLAFAYLPGAIVESFLKQKTAIAAVGLESVPPKRLVP